MKKTKNVWGHSQRDVPLGQLGTFMLDIDDVYEYKFADTIIRRKGDRPLSDVLGKDIWAKEKDIRDKEVKMAYGKPAKNMAAGDVERIKKLYEESENLQNRQDL